MDKSDFEFIIPMVVFCFLVILSAGSAAAIVMWIAKVLGVDG